MNSLTNTLYSNKHIGVLMGGASAEREISLRTGTAVLKALRAKKYQAHSIDVTASIAQALLKKKIAVAFIALHGKGGEDGTIQGTLEMLHIPYTGSGVLASALAMHKGMTKKILRYHRIPTADFQVITAETIERVDFHRKITVPLPLVVKPIAEGSTIGTSIVTHKRHLRSACRQAASCDRSILLERFIEGIEITTGIVDGKALPLIEIVPRDGFYSFRSKYTPGSTDYIVPARITKKSAAKIQHLSLRAYHALGCEGVARVDLILSHHRKQPYILEINTIPGMTETSLLPMAARSAGIEFDELVEKMLHTARLKEIQPEGRLT
jgi:D-alanine-D-alanine ligase